MSDTPSDLYALAIAARDAETRTYSGAKSIRYGDEDLAVVSVKDLAVASMRAAATPAAIIALYEAVHPAWRPIAEAKPKAGDLAWLAWSGQRIIGYWTAWKESDWVALIGSSPKGRPTHFLPITPPELPT